MGLTSLNSELRTLKGPVSTDPIQKIFGIYKKFSQLHLEDAVAVL